MKLETQVLIAGAGPVGMTLALDLASRGISVVIVEQRESEQPPSVKCNHVSARSMEIFRRLGIAGQVRDAGLPPDYPHDVSYRLTTVGPEFTRIRIASRSERFTALDDGPDSAWPTPEPPHRINQIYLEPVLQKNVVASERIDARYSTQLTSFEQSATGVRAHAVDRNSGQEILISARYLIGCDGGRSAVRKAIGASYSGDAVIQRVQSTFLRAEGLIPAMQERPAWAMFSLNPRRTGNVYSIDGKELWLVHNYLREDEPDFNSVDRDRSIRLILGVGEDFEYEALNNEDWFGRRLVADKLRDRRVFICGDAAHLWVPYAGYGMNAGIADAANLAWLMAACLNGWAPESILDNHELERLPITEQVSRFAMDHCIAMARQRSAVPREIEDETEAGEAARAALARAAYDLNVQQYCCAGLNFGYFYDQSRIISYGSRKAPAYTMGDYEPSTVPGCRTPHLYLKDGTSLYDACGPDYALLRFDAAVDVCPFLDRAAELGVPFRLVDVASDDEALSVFDTKLLISRPDQHVAWKGDDLAGRERELLDLIRGASMRTARSAA